MQELVGMRLRHKNFGEGVVLSCTGDYLAVQVKGGTATFIVPDAFYGGLTAQDPENQAKIVSAIENWRESASERQIERFERYCANKEKVRETEEEIRLKKEEKQRAKRLESDKRVAVLIANFPKVTWKHVVTLVLACVGAFFGLLGSILCLFQFLDLYAPLMGGIGTRDANIYLSFYVVLGFGGTAISFVGGLLVFFRKTFGKVCVILGLLMLISLLVETCMMVDGFDIIMSVFVLLADIILLPQAVFALLAKTQK